LVEVVPDGESLRLTFRLGQEEPSLLPYLIPKGYVTIDGASLTLTGVHDRERTFSVMLIKHTQDSITLGKKAIGAKVNIEVDMVGKYVQKSVAAALGGHGDEGIKAMIVKVVEEHLSKTT
jgi:riboflavin synthase